MLLTPKFGISSLFFNTSKLFDDSSKFFYALQEYFPIRHHVKMFIVLEKRYEYKHWANYGLTDVLFVGFIL